MVSANMNLQRVQEEAGGRHISFIMHSVIGRFTVLRKIPKIIPYLPY